MVFKGIICKHIPRYRKMKPLNSGEKMCMAGHVHRLTHPHFCLLLSPGNQISKQRKGNPSLDNYGMLFTKIPVSPSLAIFQNACISGEELGNQKQMSTSYQQMFLGFCK